MYGRKEYQTGRIFGMVYFLSTVALLVSAVCFLSSGQSGVVLQAVLHPFVRQEQEDAGITETDGADIIREVPVKEENTVLSFDTVLDADVVYRTPADVQDMEAEYLAVFATKNTDGEILEDDFSSSGATDRVRNAVIRNATASTNPDFEGLLSLGADLDISACKEPLVLLYHTHTSESYLLSDNGVFWNSYETHTDENDRNMIRIGETMKAVLEKAGIGVIHDTTVYDEEYNGAYARSRAGIEEILARWPSVQIVLDIHRDAFYYSDTARGKPVAVIDGKKAAQIMIISGTEEGQITDFPDWESNLRFALELQNTAGTMYENLMRPLYFCQRKYNMDIMKNALLLEIGSDANTLDEALYAATLFADVLVKVIENHK